MEAKYLEWRRRAILSRLKYGRALGIFGMVFFVVLDVLAHAEIALELLAWRIGSISFVALTSFLDFTKFGQRNPHVSMQLLLWGLAIPMAAMTVELGGFQSSYYMGIPLIYAGGAAIFPWRWSVHLSGQLVTVVFYFAANFYFHGTADFSPYGWEDLFFIVWFLTLFDAVIFAYERIFRDEFGTMSDLEAAHKKIQDRERTKSRYFSDMNQELRGWLDEIDALSRQGATGPAQEGDKQQLLKEISKNIIPLKNVLTNFLDYSLLETGTYPVSQSSVSVKSICIDVIDMMQPRLTERQNTVKSSFGDECTVHSDPAIIRDSIAKMLFFVNSLARNTTIKITANTEQGITGKQVTVEISCEGFGLAVEQRTVTFLPFMRAGPEYSLDLPNTRLKIRLIGGDITIGGTMGKRTVFTLTLPVEYQTVGREEISRAFSAVTEKPGNDKY